MTSVVRLLLVAQSLASVVAYADCPGEPSRAQGPEGRTSSNTASQELGTRRGAPYMAVRVVPLPGDTQSCMQRAMGVFSLDRNIVRATPQGSIAWSHGANGNAFYAVCLGRGNGSSAVLGGAGDDAGSVKREVESLSRAIGSSPPTSGPINRPRAGTCRGPFMSAQSVQWPAKTLQQCTAAAGDARFAGRSEIVEQRENASSHVMRATATSVTITCYADGRGASALFAGASIQNDAELKKYMAAAVNHMRSRLDR